MNLARRNQYSPQKQTNRGPLWTLQNEMNSLFDQFFGSDYSLASVSDQMQWPSIEIKEDENQYYINAEIPGVEEKDIQLTLTDNTLEISGERKKEVEEEKEGRYFSEISYGKFYRAIPFDQEVDDGKVEAKMKDGVLKITVSKTGQSKSKGKKIQITH